MAWRAYSRFGHCCLCNIQKELIMSIEVGYALSSEEHSPRDLVHYAKRAEETGFSFELISDHYHPWIERQGRARSYGVSSALLRKRPSGFQ